MTSSISIIIPTFNEEDNLENLLNNLQQFQGVEVIVADGGSTDKTTDIALKHNIKLVTTLPDRSVQQNKGAESATGEILLFLHCDTRLPENFLTHILTILDQPENVAGAFLLTIDRPGITYRIIEWGVNFRSRLLGIPYGDQALFLKKNVFEQIGGFPNQPLLEDLELVRRLNRMGKIGIAPDNVTTSPRRWVRQGPIKTTLFNQLILLRYLWGTEPQKLADLYYGRS